MGGKPTTTYLLPSGAEFEMETVPDRHAGASDVSLVPGGKIPFEEVVRPIGEIAEILFAKIKASVKEPDAVTLEFSASLKGKSTLLIVSGEGEGSIKVSLTWNKPDQRGQAP